MSTVARHFKIERPFGPYIVHTTISDELHDLLLKSAYKIRKDKKLKVANDYRKKLAGNLTEEYSYANIFTLEQRKLVNEELTWLASEYTRAQARLKNDLASHVGNTVRLPKDIIVQEPLWVNFMKAGEWNPSHNHTGDVSCVMYLKVPKEIEEENTTADHTKQSNTPSAGRIEFRYGEEIGYCTTGWVRRPIEKDIYLFPAGLVHLVYPFKSKQERISVSVNFSDSIKHFRSLGIKPPK